jgi:hypothetical protein
MTSSESTSAADALTLDEVEREIASRWDFVVVLVDLDEELVDPEARAFLDFLRKRRASRA